MRLRIHGAVQGVGFRPFVYRLAGELGLMGWVSNDAQGVSLEVEGERQILETFLIRLQREKPAHAAICGLEPAFLDSMGYTAFEIRKSDPAGERTALVLPDIATCPDCLREIFEPANRRYRYPFTNCTNCGPRFSIIEALPYDRGCTTMKRFIMCDQCQAEYDDPLDRRFHAQPNACPWCGPQLGLWNCAGKVLAVRDEALLQAAAHLRQGGVVAVKGLGGFHLMVDARQERAVRTLRNRKGREEKPFALMFPSLQAVRRCSEVSDLEERLLCAAERPIVLLRCRPDAAFVAPSVAPGNPYLGIMLPYTPLHHLLLTDLGFPVVATSGNRTEEPICTNELEALERLGGIADYFLVHDRPIARHVDDSIIRIIAGREMVLRRARGYAPLPLLVKEPIPSCIAVGAHLKNTLAVSARREVIVSQHIGDLETVQAFDAFRRTLSGFQSLYGLQPIAVACDRHPDYRSTRFARETGLPVVPVQHHYAHVLACMAENELEGPLLGVCWDGTGYGLDGSVWGGEFLSLTDFTFVRAAHFRKFGLPGGEKAVREPRRSALGLLYELYGDTVFSMEELAPVRSFSNQERKALRTMLSRRLNTPLTSSAGRLFDAVAALLNIRQVGRFEGHAAMELEFAALRSRLPGCPHRGVNLDESYDYAFIESMYGTAPKTIVVDWAPMVRGILGDLARGRTVATIAAKFHQTLVEIIVTVAHRLGEERVVLTGGCFQNKYLTELAVLRLTEENFHPYWHQRIPPNDGGIALGQIVAAAREFTGQGPGVKTQNTVL
jgi:hydrogenase maturation protein HypF